jgi:hypothetical protein
MTATWAEPPVYGGGPLRHRYLERRWIGGHLLDESAAPDERRGALVPESQSRRPQ